MVDSHICPHGNSLSARPFNLSDNALSLISRAGIVDADYPSSLCAKPADLCTDPPAATSHYQHAHVQSPDASVQKL